MKASVKRFALHQHKHKIDFQQFYGITIICQWYVSYDANKQKLNFFRLGFVAGEYNIKVKENSEQRVQIKRQEHLICRNFYNSTLFEQDSFYNQNNIKKIDFLGLIIHECKTT